MRSFHRRPYDYFLSYSSSDHVFAAELHDWLDRTCGLKVWFAPNRMSAGKPVTEELARNIAQCRGAIVLLSDDSTQSTFVKEELAQAIEEQRQIGGFQIILLRLDEVDVSARLPHIRTLKWHELFQQGATRLTLDAATDILCRPYSTEARSVPFQQRREVFVSRGWRKNEDEFAESICRFISENDVLLVGDLESQAHSDPDRIRRIMSSCNGHLIVLPFREGDLLPEETYKRFFPEVQLSTELGLAQCFVVQEPAKPPVWAGESPLLLSTENVINDGAVPPSNLATAIEEFLEDLTPARIPQHAFLSGEYEANTERNQCAKRIIEAVATLPCYWGRDYRGNNVQGGIHDKIVAAQFVVADLSSATRNSQQSDKPEVNVNSCIEAGIAWGAGRLLIPLAQSAAGPGKDSNADPDPTGPQKHRTRHIPYMFRNSQVTLYNDERDAFAPGVEFLGAVHKSTLEFRKEHGRRIINRELH